MATSMDDDLKPPGSATPEPAAFDATSPSAGDQDAVAETVARGDEPVAESTMPDSDTVVVTPAPPESDESGESTDTAEAPDSSEATPSAAESLESAGESGAFQGALPSPPPSRPRAPVGPRPKRILWHWAILAMALVVGGYLRFLGPPDITTDASAVNPNDGMIQRLIRTGDWDTGMHLHPDERFLTMVASSLQKPTSVGEYLDSQRSRMNPRNTGHEFFVYGTWPISLVYWVADALKMTDYGSVNLVGRRLMAVFDLLAIIMLFIFGTQLYDRRVGALAAVLAAFTAFSIQQSHFFTVDTAANFFVMLFFFAALDMLRRGGWPDIVFAGVALGMALASKVSVWPLAPVGILVLVLAHRYRAPAGHIPRQDWMRIAGEVVLLGSVAFLTLRVTQPDMFAGPGWPAVAADPSRYAEVTGKAPSWWQVVDRVMPAPLKPLLLPDPRWAENMQRVKEFVTGHGVDWPPNHQWWGRIPFVFPWRNMVLYGMGLPLGLAAWLAFVAALILLLRGQLKHLLPVAWVALVFGLQGGQWVASMRYFLPLYPMLTLLAAWGLVALFDASRGKKVIEEESDAGGHLIAPDGHELPPALDEPGLATEPLGSHLESQPAESRPPTRSDTVPAGPRRSIAERGQASLGVLAMVCLVVVLVGTALWGYMFSRIYSRDHSRVAGSHWIYHNIPSPLALTVVKGKGPGPFMPVTNSNSQVFDHEGKYTVAADKRLDSSRVLVPGNQTVTVDGVQLAYLKDASADPAEEHLKVWLTSQPFPNATGQLDGVIAEGEVAVNLTATEQDVRIPLPATELKAGGEFYLWLEVQGAPISGRMAVLANETTWDDAVPMGMDGYAAFDNPDSESGEGFYEGVTLQLYDEDDSGKLDRMMEGLAKADYLTISSNRVYGSTRQLPTRYPMTNDYYDLLFGNGFGYEHVADIHSYPNLGPIEVNDQPAEEAFHVYDHPKVDVFKKGKTFNPQTLRTRLEPRIALRNWEWPANPEGGLLGRLMAPLMGRLIGQPVTDAGTPAGPRPQADVMLSPERVTAERNGMDWSARFDINSLQNSSPIVATVLWYLVLLLLGILAFPLLWLALGNLHDRGWAISRVAGLLIVSWIAWLIASLGLLPHTPLLVWAVAIGLGLVSGLSMWPDRGAGIRAWLRANRRIVLVEEGVFLVLFLVFLVVRIGNPDLWHPNFGGEKPMDFAYLNATLRSVSFPPYDPWFAGGKMNYYYFGFVFIGALIQLTRIVPWLAYNLAIPALAAMTGLGVFGVVYNWLRRLNRGHLTAAWAAGLGAVLATISGNLYQVQFVANQLKNVGQTQVYSEIPGVMDVARLVAGWWAVARHQAELGIQTGWWYWNASRAIPAYGDVEPITEFPFFTFLYADLHAHMMALPITVLALTVALSWVLPGREGSRGPWRWAAGWARMGLGALAIGALWPANTWDYPTYGLVAAGALAIGAWDRLGHRRPVAAARDAADHTEPHVALDPESFPDADEAFDYHDSGAFEDATESGPEVDADSAPSLAAEPDAPEEVDLPRSQNHGFTVRSDADDATSGEVAITEGVGRRDDIAPPADADIDTPWTADLLHPADHDADEALPLVPVPSTAPAPGLAGAMDQAKSRGGPLLSRLASIGVGRLNLGWAFSVAWRGLVLLGLSRFLFQPYFKNYVQPYGSFRLWESVKTPPDAYLTVHGIFLFAIVSWASVKIAGLWKNPENRRQLTMLALGLGLPAAAILAYLFTRTTASLTPDRAASPWTPAIGVVLAVLGGILLFWPNLRAAERFGAWIFFLGVLATQFVEYVVLDGDIGRMNTVFKFYIQMWVLWAVLAAVAVGWFAPALRRGTGWLPRAWAWSFAVLVLCGLLYPITATRAKWMDRFPVMGPMDEAEKAAYEANWRPGLSGIEYENYAVYNDDGHFLTLAHDRDAFQWMLQNIHGNPVILETYRDKAYRWGSRYSINTGLPTVQGWDWHQKQQRNGVVGGIVDERVRDVHELYDSTDQARAWELLDKYNVEYVVVGDLDKAVFGADGDPTDTSVKPGVAKFDDFVKMGTAKVVYGPPQNPDVTIYQLIRPETGPQP